MISITKQLDDTDKKIIDKAAAGLTSKEIARDLRISPYSVSNRIREMKKYFNCQSIAQLIDTLNKKKLI